MTVEPGGARAGVRSVQVHDHEAEVVHAGSRVGVNLRGLDRDDVHRGDWLAAPELAGLSGRRFDAWVSVLPGARPLRSGDQVRLHHGTAQYLARVAPLEGREIAPGTAAAAVVRLDAPALVLPHDRFIVRSLSPVATVAGGEVLLAGAQRWHARERHGAFLAAVRSGDARGGDPGARRGPRAGGADAGTTSRPPGSAPARPAPRWRRPSPPGSSRSWRRRAARRRGGSAPAPWPRCARPCWPAPPSAPPRGRSGRSAGRRSSPRWCRRCRPPDAGLLLQRMVDAGELVAGEGGYAPAGAGVLGDEQAALAETILARLGAEPFAPPTLATLAEELRRPPRELGQILDVLARRGEVVRVDKDLWFASAAVDSARDVLLGAAGERR